MLERPGRGVRCLGERSSATRTSRSGWSKAETKKTPLAGVFSIWRSAGRVELETAAITAIVTGDMPLAAAVATVVDRRPSDRRPFSVAAFAERVWGAQHAEVTAKLKGVLLAERTARAADDEFVRGKADPIANLSNQLAARAIAEASGEEDEA